MKFLKVLDEQLLLYSCSPSFLPSCNVISDDNWKVIPINQLPPERQYLTENMARFKSGKSGATTHVLDMSYKEIRLTFKETSVVGVGNGMFYCDATEVIDTTINDSPMTL